jgi:uncharacterized membrane protein YfcA
VDWASWLPLGIELETSALLIMTAMCTSFITAAMGIGGGLVLLMVMATCIPLELLIPVHGLVQLGSNSNRMWIARQHIHWSVTRLFMLGGIVGTVVASLFVTSLPVAYIQVLMGVFVVFLVWLRLPDMGVFPHPLQVFFGGIKTL